MKCSRLNGVPGFLLALYIALIGFNTLTRTSDFSDPDTMNFVDVARNITAGRGIAQSTLGFNVPRFTESDSIPMPLTSQPPLFPLLIALLSMTGLSCSASALLISPVCYGLILLAAYHIARKLYDEPAALLTVGILLLYAPLRKAAGTAFSEPFGMMLACGALLTGLRIRRESGPRDWLIPLITGLLAGLTFTTRFALLPLFIALAIFIVLQSGRKGRDLCLYTVGFLLPASLVWMRNLIIIGRLMPKPNPSNIGLLTNIRKVFDVLTQESLSFIPPVIQQIFILSLVLALILLLLKKKQLKETASGILIKQGSYLVPLFGGGYLVFMIILRTRSYFDYLDWRLLIPGGTMLCLMLAALLGRATGINRKHATLLLTALVAGLILREARTTALVPRRDSAAVIAASDRLTWVSENTDENDLVIGFNTIDLVHYLALPAAASFSPFPSCDYMEHEKIIAFCRVHLADYRHFYLILPNQNRTNFDRDYGPFICQLVLEQQPYSHIHLRQHLCGEDVFEIVLETD